MKLLILVSTLVPAAGVGAAAAAAVGTSSQAPDNASGPFKPAWESLKQYRCPNWFRDAKFGIYAHWGVYSVPEFQTEWYSHWMYQTGVVHNFHVQKYGPVDKFGYKDLIPHFTGEKFNADEWAELYREAGAQFAGPVAEHADGFAMWDSALTRWNAKQMGPKRDIVGEMEKAVRKRGMRFVTTLHHSWLWGWYATPLEEADVLDPQNEDFYGPVLPLSAFNLQPDPPPDEAFCARWLAKTKEVIAKYHPDLLWFDSKLYILPEAYRREMVSYFYDQAVERGQRVVLTYKQEDLKAGTAVLDLERSRMATIQRAPWLTDTSIARNSWSYTTDLQYYSAERLVHDLVDIVSKNGCLLLNVAPRPDGTIPDEQRERLLAIGRWLKINGEAIYGSRPWRVFGEGPTKPAQGAFSDLKLKGFTAEDLRFTTGNGRFNKGRLYAIVLGLPRGPVRIRSLAGEPVVEVRLLGSSEKIQWKQEADALTIIPPAQLPCEQAITFSIRMRNPSGGQSPNPLHERSGEQFGLQPDREGQRP